jgi:hypothetical protein
MPPLEVSTMSNLPIPEVSPVFTIADIRKIRDWNSERYATMTRREIAADINSGAREFMALIENAKRALHN